MSYTSFARVYSYYTYYTYIAWHAFSHNVRVHWRGGGSCSSPGFKGCLRTNADGEATNSKLSSQTLSLFCAHTSCGGERLARAKESVREVYATRETVEMGRIHRFVVASGLFRSQCCFIRPLQDVRHFYLSYFFLPPSLFVIHSPSLCIHSSDDESPASSPQSRLIRR